MPTYLKGLKINTLGSVDNPANQHGQAVLLKRNAGGTKEEDTDIPQSLMEKITSAITKSLTSILKTEESKEDKKEELPNDQDEKKGEEDMKVEDILAKNVNLPEEVVEALKKSAKMQEQMDVLVNEAELAKAARIEQEYITKAADYKNLPGVGEKFHEVLKGLGTKAPEEFAQLEAILKSADEAISKGKLFEEQGGNGDNKSTTAWEEVEKRATEMISKDAKMTKEKAISAVLSADAELYKRYRKGE